jgi:hypothetical protein
MDALIRFCFYGVNPESINEAEEYQKLYGQARWIFDQLTVAGAAKAINAVR